MRKLRINEGESYPSSDELARKGFVSLVRLYPYGYSVLNDGYFVCRIAAENDDDAIRQFYEFLKTDWNGAWRDGTLPKYFGESKKRPMKKRVMESNPYPNDWTSDTDIHRVFSALDQTGTKNPGAIEDSYGFDMYNVGWVDGDEDIIQVYAESGNSSETFYVFPNYTNNTYRIDTEELGERTVGKATDVWDIMSTCLRKQRR